MMAGGKKGRRPAGSRERGLMIPGGRGWRREVAERVFRERSSCLALTDRHVVAARGNARALPRECGRARERASERESSRSLCSAAYSGGCSTLESIIYPLLLTLCVVHARSAAAALQPIITARDVVVVGRRCRVVSAVGSPPPSPMPTHRVWAHRRLPPLAPLPRDHSLYGYGCLQSFPRGFPDGTGVAGRRGWRNDNNNDGDGIDNAIRCEVIGSPLVCVGHT